MRRFASLVTSLALAAGALLSLPVAVQAKAAYAYYGHVYYLAVGDGQGSGNWDGASCSNPTYYTNDVNEEDGDDLTDAVAHVVDVATDDSLDGLGNTLFLCAGTYELNRMITINDDLWIAGAGTTKTIITSDGLDHRAFRIDGSDLLEVNITAMTMTGFSHDDDDETFGGVIKAFKTTLNIDAVTMSNNTDYWRGGAIALRGENEGSLTITNSKFVNNTASSACGGALFLTFGQSAVITRSTFSGNEANTEGGAICQEGDALTIDQSTFSKNVAGGGGGAVYASGIYLTVNRSNFIQNSAEWGGAFQIDSQVGDSEFFKDTFTKNAADGAGGAIANDSDGGDMYVSYSSFVGNTASDGGAFEADQIDNLYSDYNIYSSNRVSGDGAAIDSEGDYLWSGNDRFTSNTAGTPGDYGSGAAIDAWSADVTGAVFQGNVGASTVQAGNWLWLTHSSFKGNKSLKPTFSMIWTGNLNQGYVQFNTFSGNSAPSGALFGSCDSVDRLFAASNVIGKNSVLWISLPASQVFKYCN